MASPEPETPGEISPEAILEKISLDSVTAPLGWFFYSQAVPESIRTYGDKGDIIVAESRDPNADIVMKLTGWRNSGRLDFYFLSGDKVRQRPELLRQPANAFVIVRTVDPYKSQPAIEAKLETYKVDLSSPPAQSFLRMLEEISARYDALRRISVGQGAPRLQEDTSSPDPNKLG